MTPRVALAFLALALPAGGFAQNVVEVQVAPPSLTLRVGERTGLLATAFDRVGNVIPTIRFVWSSNNVAVATVDDDGTVTGVGGGVAIIEARAGVRKGQAGVQVLGAPPAGPSGPQPQPGRVQEPIRPEPGGAVDPLGGQPTGVGPAAVLRIEPPTVYLLPSENARAFPRALREDGSPAAPVAVTWRSLRPDIASVDENGVIVALSPGQGTVQATSSSGLTATAPVVVQQTDVAIAEAGPITLGPGDVGTLHVIVPAQGNRVVNPLALQWFSADPSVARVSLAGVVTAVAPGRTTLTVSGLLRTNTLDVVVHKAVQALEVRPPQSVEVALPIQGTVKFVAQALALDRQPVPEAVLQWSVGDPSLASLDPVTGLLTGKQAGRTELVVKAPGSGVSVTWSIRVIAASVKLSTPRLGLALNRRYPLRASFADEAGAVIGPAGVTWASDNPQVAAVGEDGTVSAGGYGRARITATGPGGQRATVDVFVQGELVVASSRSGRFQLYSAERSNPAQLRKVMDDAAAATEPAFSPDGSRIAFVSTRDGQPEIYVMDADGTGATRLTNSRAADGAPSFTADGQAVVFHSRRTAHRQLFVQPITASDAIQLTQEPADNSQPSVSPDGETIAFISNRDGNDDLWLMSKDGSNQRNFTRSAQVRERSPHFLRDGSLAFLTEARLGGRPAASQIVKADLVSGRLTPLAASDLPITDFAPAPAGDLVALVVAVQKNVFKVYLQPVGTGGGGPVPLPTTGAEQMVSPAFLP